MSHTKQQLLKQIIICEVHQEPLKPDAVIEEVGAPLVVLHAAAEKVLHKRYIFLGTFNLDGGLIKDIDVLEMVLKDSFSDAANTCTNFKSPILTWHEVRMLFKNNL